MCSCSHLEDIQMPLKWSTINSENMDTKKEMEGVSYLVFMTPSLHWELINFFINLYNYVAIIIILITIKPLMLASIIVRVFLKAI